MIGKEIANYRITELLGEGGMGVVYKGVDLNLDRPVAIKVLSSDLVRNPELVERFRAEARAQANLNHTNLATLYSFVVHEGTAMMVMEFVDGETLEKMIRRRGPIASQEAIPLFKQALLGIGHAHRMGIIHRDLKPSNLMLGRNGIVKVMDFGIAKVMGTRGMTRTGTQMGTAFYMSPEQVLNKRVDIRSDIYSLGVTLYEMLSAHVPFEAESDYQIMASHVSAPPPLPTRFYPYIPKGVENAVLRAMEKNPDARFQTVEEFGEALEHPQDYVAPVAAEAATPGRTVVEGGRGVAPATVPESGEAALVSPTPPLPSEEEARGRLGFFPSKYALMALAGAAVVLVGVLLFAFRHKVVPPPPPPPQNKSTVNNTQSASLATNQNQSFEAVHTIENATQTEQGETQKAPPKQPPKTSRQNTATETPSAVETPSAAAPAQATTIPAGTVVAVRMIDEIDPQRSRQGQTFRASLDSPVWVGNEVAILTPADALVELVGASTAGHYSGRSSLTLKLVQVSVQGRNYAVSSEPYVVQGSSRGKRSGEVIGGAAAAGALIGSIFGHKKKNAAVGGVAGAGAGAAGQQLTNPQEVTIASETKIQFKLNRSLTLPQTQ